MGGQCCCASSRILVDEKISDEFAERCAKKARTMKIGTEEGCQHGPQVDKIQFDKVMGYIEKGKAEGAKCLEGGERHGDKGYFIKPTVFADVEDGMTIAKEEIFGPVMQLMRFKTVEEAITRATTQNSGWLQVFAAPTLPKQW